MSEIDNRKKLGKNIKALCKAHGETQEELAAFLHIDPRTLTNYLNGKHQVDDKTKEKIAKHYMVTIYELQYDDFTGLKKISYDENIFLRNIDLFFPIIQLDSYLNDTHFERAYTYHKKAYNKFRKLDLDGVDYLENIMCEYLEVIETSLSEEFSTMDELGIAATLNIWGIRNLMLTMLVNTSIAIEEKPSFMIKAISNNKKDLNKMLESNNTDEFSEIINGIYEIIDPEILASIKAIVVKSPTWSDLAYFYLAMEYVLKIVDNGKDHNYNTMVGIEMISALAGVGNIYAQRYIKFGQSI